MSPLGRSSLVVAGALLAIMVLPAREAAAEPPPRYASTDPGPESPQQNNPDMMVAGVVITALGIFSLPFGAYFTGVSAVGGSSSDPTAVRMAYAGAGLLVGHFILSAIGIPLWVNGAKPAKPKRWWAQPSVSPGPRGVTLRWALPL
jgi:hypothetical protein